MQPNQVHLFQRQVDAGEESAGDVALILVRAARQHRPTEMGGGGSENYFTREIEA